MSASNNPVQADDDFYHFFDSHSNNGRVLELDLSRIKKLPTTRTHKKERVARDEWNTERKAIIQHYRKKDRSVSSSTALLMERVCPPMFVTKHPSTRYGSEGRKPVNPTDIYVWGDFRRLVAAFEPPKVQNLDGDALDDAFRYSIASDAAVRDESDEFQYLQNHVLSRLRTAGLVDYPDDQRVGAHGQVDYSLAAKTEKDVTAETTEPGTETTKKKKKKRRKNKNAWKMTLAIGMKATHSLPMPVSADAVVRRHKIGIALNHEMGAVYRKRVCNPLGHLLRYMTCNGIRVGALSTASRTYFVFIEDVQDGGTTKVAGKVQVSDAWFIGEKDFLRAWAYCYHLSSSADRYDGEEVDWAHPDEQPFVDKVKVDDDAGPAPRGGHPDYKYDEDSDEEDNDDGDGDDNGWAAGDVSDGNVNDDDAAETQKRSRKHARKDAVVSSTRGSEAGRTLVQTSPKEAIRSSVIPTVPFSSISFESPLGYGRNGCVFRARCGGKSVAVKQFDLGVPGVLDRAKREIFAYEKLIDVQGILIPKAFFLAVSRVGILHLGLQLGRGPRSRDDVSHWEEVLGRLRSEFGFEHGDDDGRNGVIIRDEKGKEHLVAIDLEDHEFVPNQNQSLSRSFKQ